MKSKIMSAAMAATLTLAFASCGKTSTNTSGDYDAAAEETSSVSESYSDTSEAEVSIDMTEPEIGDIIGGNPIIVGGDINEIPDYHLDDESMVEILKDNSDGVNALNMSLIDLTVDSDDKSAMISGFSAYSCLSSAAKYAEGNTKTQIENALGAMNPEALDYFKTHMPIETGTLFLIDDATVLNAEKSDDFTFRDLQADDIVDFVNNYVSDKTHNLITNITSGPFEDDCRAAIIDTLYFKGTWEHKFPESATDKQTFYGVDGSTETDFMHATYKYGVDVDNDIIELRYKYSDLAMDICYDVSDDDISKAFGDYIDNLEGLNDRLDHSYDVNLSMPKFETESSLNIVDAYKTLGMTDMFDPACAEDFKSLADDVYVSDIIQKTKIIVDEEGTEAAAVTMMTMDAACAPGEPKILDIVIDKPFVYAIRDTETNIILFAGYVNGF